MAGRFDEARAQLEASTPVLDEVNLTDMSWRVSRWRVSETLQLMGDTAAAEQDLIAVWLHFRDTRGERPASRALNAAARLAHLCCDQGRWEEAAEYLTYGQEVDRSPPPTGDVYALRDSPRRARIAAHAGNHAEAVELARDGGRARRRLRRRQLRGAHVARAGRGAACRRASRPKPTRPSSGRSSSTTARATSSRQRACAPQRPSVLAGPCFQAASIALSTWSIVLCPVSEPDPVLQERVPDVRVPPGLKRVDHVGVVREHRRHRSHEVGELLPEELALGQAPEHLRVERVLLRAGDEVDECLRRGLLLRGSSAR